MKTKLIYLVVLSVITTAGVITICNLLIAGYNKTSTSITNFYSIFGVSASELSVPKETVHIKTETVEEEIRRLASEANFKWIDWLVRLARCENTNLIPTLRGHMDDRDRGIFQINSYWHSEVSDECAFDVECSTKWTMWRVNNGYQHEWMCNELI